MSKVHDPALGRSVGCLTSAVKLQELLGAYQQAAWAACAGGDSPQWIAWDFIRLLRVVHSLKLSYFWGFLLNSFRSWLSIDE